MVAAPKFRSLFIILTSTRRDLDPSRSVSLRARFEAAIVRRFRIIWREVVKSVGDNDCFGLASRPKTLQAIPPREFEFRRDADKVVAFIAWLQEMVDKNILELYYMPMMGRQGIWADTFVLSAYQKGLTQGRADLRAAGAPIPPYNTASLAAALTIPFNADRLDLIFTRTFTDLKGITEAMDAQISRVLAQGLAEGVNPYEMARRIVNRVDGIGINRARILARTETMYALNSATLSEYAAAENVIGKQVMVQWWTAQDERVCPICAPRHGQVYTREEIQKIMVPHPNCRCAFLPYIEGTSIPYKGGNA